MLKQSIRRYIERNQIPHRLEPSTPVPDKSGRAGFRSVVVIPVYAESSFLPDTLKSLVANPSPELDETLIFVVINNPPASETDPVKFADNQNLLKKLRAFQFPEQKRLKLYWIDASSPGFEIDKKTGVGAARKLGMDIALNFLDWNCDPLMFCLDADTLVEPNYIEAVRCFYNLHSGTAGAVIDFAHQTAKNAEEDVAIINYELLMRYYTAGLRISRSPYAYHSLGSAITCDAPAYVRAGGMRKRNGGEDFYFLQALRKTGSIGVVYNTCVHPSARLSDRVPFGTGPKVSALLKAVDERERDKTGKRRMAYNPGIFLMIGRIFSDVADGSLNSPEKWLRELPKEISAFFEEYKFCENWRKIIVNTPHDSEKIKWAFHIWFDAFRTLKFVHFCENQWPGEWPRLEILHAWELLLGDVGEKLPEETKFDHASLLEWVRDWEKRSNLM